MLARGWALCWSYAPPFAQPLVKLNSVNRVVAAAHLCMRIGVGGDIYNACDEMQLTERCVARTQRTRAYA